MTSPITPHEDRLITSACYFVYREMQACIERNENPESAEIIIGRAKQGLQLMYDEIARLQIYDGPVAIIKAVAWTVTRQNEKDRSSKL